MTCKPRTLLLAVMLLPTALAAQTISINDFSFIAGYWKGTGLGGAAEEMWMPPVDGRMFGVFKHSENGRLNFTEYMEIVELDGEWVMRLKHFGADFTGWEEKNDSVTFPLREVKTNELIFEGLTYRLNDDELRVTVTLHYSDGRTAEEPFDYQKQPL